jgi:hypothetical protein
MRRRLRNLGLALASFANDALALAGAILVSYGAWLVYRPAGFIVGGALLLAASIYGARGA